MQIEFWREPPVENDRLEHRREDERIHNIKTDLVRTRLNKMKYTFYRFWIRSVNWRGSFPSIMVTWLWRKWPLPVSSYYPVIYMGNWGEIQDTFVIISGISIEIRTGHLSNACQSHCRSSWSDILYFLWFLFNEEWAFYLYLPIRSLLMPYPAFLHCYEICDLLKALHLRACVTHVAVVSFCNFMTKNPILYICIYVTLNFEIPCEMY
jgi:hypothetical protein